MNELTWSSAGLTDVGLARSENQDALFISPDRRLFVVADGMGGAMNGALASRLAVEAAETHWKSVAAPMDVEPLKKWLEDLVLSANMNVFSASPKTNLDDLLNAPMGTTMVAVYMSTDGHAYVAHVGDSRAYLVREGESSVVTNDHSIVMEMYRRGQLTLDQCKTNKWRHVITRCLGHNENVEVELTTVPLTKGDWIVVASDGLSSVIDDEKIAPLLVDCSSPEMVCDALMDATMAEGAPDNTTIIAINYEGGGPGFVEDAGTAQGPLNKIVSWLGKHDS